jgi:alpha-L-fucosidase
VFVPYAVLALSPTAGRGVLPDRRLARLVALAGVFDISTLEIAGDAPRLLACRLVARVERRVDIVGGGNGVR